jgi:hypothetical protein
MNGPPERTGPVQQYFSRKRLCPTADVFSHHDDIAWQKVLLAEDSRGECDCSLIHMAKLLRENLTLCSAASLIGMLAGNFSPPFQPPHGESTVVSFLPNALHITGGEPGRR